MGRGPAVSQEPFTACASSPYPLRTPPGSSASIASKPAILAKIMHRRPAADLSERGPIFAAMHAVRCAACVLVCPRGAVAAPRARRAPRPRAFDPASARVGGLPGEMGCADRGRESARAGDARLGFA